MNKLTVFLSVILVGCLMACATPNKAPDPIIPPPPDAEVYKPETGVSISIENWEINYALAAKRGLADNDIRCYKILKITKLPNPERNIWYKAGFRVGDYMSMFESRPGFMGTLFCEVYEDHDIEKWFPGKVRDNIYEEDGDGFWVERLRFDGPTGGFSLETLQVFYE